MFVVSLTYKVPEDIVDYHRPRMWPGLSTPSTTACSLRPDAWFRALGGLLLSKADRTTLDASLAKDPFYSNGVAEFEVIEFTANRVAPGFENLLDDRAANQPTLGPLTALSGASKG